MICIIKHNEKCDVRLKWWLYRIDVADMWLKFRYHFVGCGWRKGRPRGGRRASAYDNCHRVPTGGCHTVQGLRFNSHGLRLCKRRLRCIRYWKLYRNFSEEHAEHVHVWVSDGEDISTEEENAVDGDVVRRGKECVDMSGQNFITVFNIH